MRIKGITDEDFVNYKVPSMFIATACCTFKCDIEAGMPICQNSSLAQQPDIDVSMLGIVERYQNNPITKAIVFGGLEPLDDGDTLMLIDLFRSMGVMDDVVIYTGYTRHEAGLWVSELRRFPNIVIKFGRYIPGQKPHYDPVLGVKLASDNQYAERITE